jgi:hypothetical protein
MPNYLNRRPKTARRVKPDVRQTAAQKRASVINFALFRLVSAHSTACIVYRQLESLKLDDVGFPQYNSILRAMDAAKEAEIALKESMDSLWYYNSVARKVAALKKEAKKGAKP